MTDFYLVAGGLVLGAICLGVGYLLGKKKKVVSQVQAEIDRIKAQAELLKQSAIGAVKNQANKL